MWKKFELKVITFIAYLMMRLTTRLCWMMVRRMPVDLDENGKERRSGARLAMLKRES